MTAKPKTTQRVGDCVVRTWLDNSACASFEVLMPVSFSYIADGVEVVGETYVVRGALSNAETTTDVDAAEIYARGSVKFDGCTNFTVIEDHDCMVHTCNGRQFADFLAAVVEARRLAASLMDPDTDVNREYAK